MMMMMITIMIIMMMMKTCPSAKKMCFYCRSRRPSTIFIV